MVRLSPIPPPSPKQHSLIGQHRITPEEVAQQMIRLMEDPELIGGTILEVAHQSSRVVPAFMNPGPSGTGVSISHGNVAQEETLELVQAEGWGVLK
jgi:hypothetical protein